MNIDIRHARGSLSFNDVAKQLERFPEELRVGAMRKGSRAVAGEIKTDLRGRLPRGDRPLPRPMGRWTRWRRTRDTVKVWTARSRRSTKAFVSIAGGIYLLEYGTRNMAPRKYVETSLKVIAARAPKIYAGAIRKAIPGLARKMDRGLLRDHGWQRGPERMRRGGR